MENRTCKTCGSEFTNERSGPGRPRSYCSDSCRNRRQRVGRYDPRKYASAPRIPCSACGGPTGYTVNQGRRLGVVAPRCRSCTRLPCGSVSSYRRGCRCDDCKAANAQSMREYAAKRKERDGVSLYSQNRKYDGAHGHFIPKADRLSVYERDGWVCQLCGDPVVRSLHFNDRMAATLDHIEPQSSALIADHRVENLRLAHRACNSRRWNVEREVVTESVAV